MPGGCGPTRIGTRELSATGFGLLFRLNKEKIGISRFSLPTITIRYVTDPPRLQDESIITSVVEPEPRRQN